MTGWEKTFATPKTDIRYCQLKKKKKNDLKVENYVFIEQTYWGLKPQATVSLKTLRDCSKEVKEEPGYKGVFGKKKPQIKVVEHQKISVN